MSVKVFNMPVDIADQSPSKSFNEKFYFGDYSEIESVCWVGDHDNNLDCELRTHDGKEEIVNNSPIAYYKMGSGRETLAINRKIENNSIHVKLSYEKGGRIKGSLIFTVKR